MWTLVKGKKKDNLLEECQIGLRVTRKSRDNTGIRTEFSSRVMEECLACGCYFENLIIFLSVILLKIEFLWGSTGEGLA